MKRGDLLTAPQVARHCNADLKTIHNWVNAGKIRFFRTPGRHLRFRLEDVVGFLEEFGYPVPPGLSSSTRPKVVVLTEDVKTADAIRAELGERVHLKLFDCPIHALLTIGREQPEVVVLDMEHPDVEPESFISKITSAEAGPSSKVMVCLSQGKTSDAVQVSSEVATMNKKDISKMWHKVTELLTADESRCIEPGVG